MGPHDASLEVKTQVFKAFDLCDKLFIYSNVAHTIFQHILGFIYIDPEPIFLAKEIY